MICFFFYFINLAMRFSLAFISAAVLVIIVKVADSVNKNGIGAVRIVPTKRLNLFGKRRVVIKKKRMVAMNMTMKRQQV
jgi:hypothetical protein